MDISFEIVDDLQVKFNSRIPLFLFVDLCPGFGFGLMSDRKA